jgi:hypothetical protein
VSADGPRTTRDYRVRVTLIFTHAPGRGAGDALQRVVGMMPWVLLRLAAYRLGAQVTVETVAV